MQDKRRDNKGRVLLPGERQRDDGRYEYRYTDSDGGKHSVYSWRLVSTDKVPKGKKSELPLRDMERQIKADAEDDIKSEKARRTTLDDYFDTYFSLRSDLKNSTRAQYLYTYNKHVRGGFGTKKISDIKYSDIKRFCIELATEKGLGRSAIHNVHAMIQKSLDSAVKDNLIRYNPCKGVREDVYKVVGKRSSKRGALSIKQQATFINYCLSSKRYRRWAPLFIFLLGTGCRISEAAALRWEDCDFEQGVISINHALWYGKLGEESHKYHIGTPKSKAGIRIIPMIRDVREVLLEEKQKQIDEHHKPPVIDGYTNFVFRNHRGGVINTSVIDFLISCVIDRYNDEEERLASLESREPEFLPRFSVHTLRHTFCTRYCENETNLKIIQEIMGHSNIRTTMDIYNEATTEAKKRSFSNLEKRMVIR